MEAVDSDTDSKMSNKRKADEADKPDEAATPKQARRRRRSLSEPRNTGSEGALKREALHRLFGRYYFRDGIRFDDEEDHSTEGDDYEDPEYTEDPLLLDVVPECMDPEQLGFLLCAQETLRFLRQSGMSFHHNVYMSLRSRFVTAMKDLGIA